MRINPGKWILFIALLIAAGLRFWHLGFHDLWYDEALSLQVSGMFFEEQNSSYLAHHPPLYFIFLDLWSRFFGSGEFSIRFPSFVFSLCSVWVLFALAKRNFNYRVGLFAAIFCGLSSFQIWYAQEARPYALLGLLSILSAYSFFEVVNERPGRQHWFFYAISTTLGLYTHTTYLIFFLTQVFLFVFFFCKPAQKVNFRLFLFVVLVLFIPRCVSLFREYLIISYGFWVPKPVFWSLVSTLENFFFGYGLPIVLYRSCIVIILVLMVAVFFGSGQARQNMLVCWALFILPVLALFFHSQFFHPVYIDRALIFSSYFCYLLTAIGLDNIAQKKNIILLGVILVGFQVLGIKAYIKDEMPTKMFEHRVGVTPKKPYEPAVKFVSENCIEGDVIAFSTLSAWPSFVYYGPKDICNNCKYFFHPDYSNDTRRKAYYADKKHIPLFKIADLPARRIWLIAGDWDRSGDLRWHRNSFEVKNFMDKNFKLCLERSMNGLSISVYAKEPDACADRITD